MALFESQRPKRSREPSWDHVKLESGKVWKGWCAGPSVTVCCHYLNGGSKACRREMTNGDLACVWCAEGIDPTYRTYCPHWSETGVRCFSVVGDRYRELAERITTLQPVRVTKLVARGSPIRVEQFAWSTAHPPIDPLDTRPQDITPWLLKVWGDDAIREWVAAHPVSDKPVSQTAPAATREEMEALPEKDIRRHIANRLLRENGHPPLAVRDDDQQPADDPASLDDTLASLARKLPSLNGTHKKAKRKT